jgi:hypothetical protein
VWKVYSDPTPTHDNNTFLLYNLTNVPKSWCLSAENAEKLTIESRQRVRFVGDLATPRVSRAPKVFKDSPVHVCCPLTQEACTSGSDARVLTNSVFGGNMPTDSVDVA